MLVAGLPLMEEVSLLELELCPHSDIAPELSYQFQGSLNCARSRNSLLLALVQALARCPV